MKKGLVVSIFALVFFASLASAQMYTCDDDNTIMRLSATTNAHGALYNQGGYATQICFDDLFDGSLTSPVSHLVMCTDGDGLIVRLAAATNAHAQGLEQTGYSTEVCYADLDCRTVGIATNCDQDEAVVLRLSDQTNAHLEVSNGTGNYAYKVCCSVPSGSFDPIPTCGNNNCEDGEIASCPTDCTGAPPPPTGSGFTDLKWRDGFDMITNQSWVNSSVYIFVQGPVGTPMTIRVREQDLIDDDDIATLNILTDNSGIGEVLLPISDSLYDAGDEGAEGGQLELYFEVTFDTTTNESTQFPQGGYTGILYVNNFENPNTIPLVANITGDLVHQGIYYNGTGIDFDHNSVDDSGIANIEWTVEKSGVVEFTNTNENFTHSFATPGERVITLKVTDYDNIVDTQQIAILVIGSPGAFAFIEKPFHLELVNVSDRNGDGIRDYWVNFSARDSFVVQSDVVAPSCLGTVECLAGNCPLTTQNLPIGCGSGTQPIVGGAQPYNFVTFAWNFADVGTLTGIANASGIADYTSSGRSNALGDRHIDLTINYTQGAISLVETVSRDFTLGQCLDGGHKFFDLVDGVMYNTDAPNGGAGCAGVDNVNGTNDDCCAPGRVCTVNGCVPVAGFNACNDYTTLGSCNNDVYNIAPIDPLWDNFNCDDGDVDCYCGWNETISAGQNCGLVVENIGAPIVTTGTPCNGWSCTYHSVDAECVNGFMDIVTTVTYNPGTCPNQQTQQDLGCIDKTIPNVPCGQFNIELGFFDYTQFIVTIASIFLVYATIFWRASTKRR